MITGTAGDRAWRVRQGVSKRVSEEAGKEQFHLTSGSKFTEGQREIKSTGEELRLLEFAEFTQVGFTLVDKLLPPSQTQKNRRAWTDRQVGGQASKQRAGKQQAGKGASK